jgi:hypothetical protein
MKKFTIPEFAAKIRNKYPNSYNDLQDKELVNLWVKKYPADNEFINYGSNNWFTYISILAIIVGVFYFYGSTKSESIDGIEHQYPDDSNGNQEPETYEETKKNYEYTQEAKDIINNSPIIKVLNLDNSTTNTLLTILSDPNPDPENQSGESCYSYSSKCYYCNEPIPGKIYTYQEYFRIELNCEGAFSDRCTAAMILLKIPAPTSKNEETESNSSGTIDEQLKSIDWKELIQNSVYSSATSPVLDFRPVIENACSNFNTGIKTMCIEKPIYGDSKDFCSVKCKTEYHYSH